MIRDSLSRPSRVAKGARQTFSFDPSKSYFCQRCVRWEADSADGLSKVARLRAYAKCHPFTCSTGEAKRKSDRLKVGANDRILIAIDPCTHSYRPRYSCAHIVAIIVYT